MLALAQATAQAVFGIKGSRRHGQMHMGMKLQAARVGMQHTHRSGAAFELAVWLPLNWAKVSQAHGIKRP